MTWVVDGVIAVGLIAWGVAAIVCMARKKKEADA